MAPFHMKILNVEGLHEVKENKSKNKKVEKNPRNKESTVPFSHSIKGKTVTNCRESGKKAEETSTEKHSFTVSNLICKCHGDQSDSSNQITDVKEEKAS